MRGRPTRTFVLTLGDDGAREGICRSELTEIGRQINNRLLTAPVEVYATLLAIYFVLNGALSAGMRLFEDRRIFNRVFCFFAR